jgi:uncharacterized protein with von Willebrand factor type A (vWA) domain
MRGQSASRPPPCGGVGRSVSAGAYRYGAWDGGPDPLATPYDVAGALDELGDSVLEGASPREALSALLRQGTEGRRGLEELLRKVRHRQREVRRRGQLDGTLEEVRELLDRALGQERAALFPDPDDGARLAEAELDTLPNDPARAVRALADYEWRSPAARQTYKQISELLRREVLDSHFRGMKAALASTSPEDTQRVKDMLADLNAMLAAEARGEDTAAAFERFMGEYGDFLPDNPTTLEELVDSLARRAAAASRLLASLSDAQREELANLLAAAREDLGLAAEMDRLGSALRERRPDLDWSGSERMHGEAGMGVGDATTALEELADLSELESTLRQDYPGADLDDVDPEALERALGRSAVDDVEALRRLERELSEQGFLTRTDGRLELTARAVRRIGATALRRVFASLEARGRGQHDVADAGAAGELTGASRGWQFGDEQPLDVVRTVRNAVMHSPRHARGVRLRVEDFEVVETERRTSAAVCLLVDLSYSMELRGTWGTAKTTALALHSLVTTRYPQDAIEIIGFSDYARVLSPGELAGLSWDMVQGTNLQHGLMLAGRHLRRHPDGEQVVLVVTDGEPTAHLSPAGQAEFAWPPVPETVTATMAEVEKLTRGGATINVFMLDDEPRLVRFVEGLAQRNGGRVFAPAPDRLGEYVVRDYLRARRGRRGR